MPRTLSRKKSDQMLDIARQYVEQGGQEPLDLEEVARFAIENNHWGRHGIKNLQFRLCKREFSQAFREQYHTDAQGRNVRTLHAKREYDSDGKQKTFWGDIRQVDDEYAQAAFHQRRTRIVGDCRQLKTDVDSYNDNNINGGHYQLLLDFRDDVAEREQPTTYMPRKPK